MKRFGSATTEEERAQEREAARKGGQARAAQASADAARRKGGETRATRDRGQAGYFERQRARGLAGFQATLARYGPAFAIEKVAAYRKAHQSRAEAWTQLELESLGYVWCRDYWMEIPCPELGPRVLLDFVVELPGERYAIIQPGSPRWHNAARDAAHDAVLRDLGLFPYRLDSDLIVRDPDTARRQLHQMLGLTNADSALDQVA
jgi:hypothetical protein